MFCEFCLNKSHESSLELKVFLLFAFVLCCLLLLIKMKKECQMKEKQVITYVGTALTMKEKMRD